MAARVPKLNQNLQSAKVMHRLIKNINISRIVDRFPSRKSCLIEIYIIFGLVKSNSPQLIEDAMGQMQINLKYKK